MRKILRTATLVVALATSVWTLALVDFTGIASSFVDGDEVSASAFNELFAAIDGNFTAAETAIEANEAAIGQAGTSIASLQAFDAALAAGGCPEGEAVRAVDAGGNPTCADVSSGLALPLDEDLLQTGSANGAVRAAAAVVCGSTGSSVARAFNLVEGANGTVGIANGAAPGRCTLDFGFKVDDRYWTVSAIAVNAPKFAGCFPGAGADETKLHCSAFDGSGTAETGAFVVTVF